MYVTTSADATRPNGPTTSPAPDAPPPKEGGGRDSHGRFAPGNGGGPGNPFARQVAALRQALLAGVTEEDLEAVARELVRQAREGNLAAAKLLLSYTLGKPAQAVDPDTLDLHEWALYRQAPDAERELAARQTAMPLALACEYARAATEAMTIAARHKLSDELHAWEAEQEAKQRRAARRKERAERRKQEQAARPAMPPAVAPPDAPAVPPPEPGALDRLAKLLGLPPDVLSASGGAAPPPPSPACAPPCQAVPPPSTNGSKGASPGPRPPSADGGATPPDTPRR